MSNKNNIYWQGYENGLKESLKMIMFLQMENNLMTAEMAELVNDSFKIAIELLRKRNEKSC